MSLETPIIENQSFKGLEYFINIFLFDDVSPPKPASDGSYKLGEFLSVPFKYHDWADVFADPQSGMRYFENTLTGIAVNEHYKEVREEIVKCYLSSEAKNIIQDLIALQMKSYIGDLAPWDLDEEDIEFAFLETLSPPVHIKAYLSNHFADIFNELKLTSDKISKCTYDGLLVKYLRNNTLAEIRHNVGAGIHNQITEHLGFENDLQRKGYVRHLRYRIKARIKD